MTETRIPLRLEFDFDGVLDGFGLLETKPTGERRIIVNMAAILWVCHSEPDANWKEITADTVLHEVLHAIQDAIGKLMREDEVDAAIEHVRAMSHETIAAIPITPQEFNAYETTLARAEHAESVAEADRQALADLRAQVTALSTTYRQYEGTLSSDSIFADRLTALLGDAPAPVATKEP